MKKVLIYSICLTFFLVLSQSFVPNHQRACFSTPFEGYIDSWQSFLHDSWNSGYSTTSISSKINFGKVGEDFANQTCYGGVIANDLLILSLTNDAKKSSEVVCYNIKSLILVWRSSLPNALCFTSPVLNDELSSVFVASTNGFTGRDTSSSIISCLNMSDGTIKWTSEVKGAVFCSMLYQKQRLFYQNFYAESNQKNVTSQQGNIGCMNTENGEKVWVNDMQYSFNPGENDNNLLPVALENQIIVPNTYLTFLEDNQFSAGDSSLLYSFDQITGNKNWQLDYANAILPSVSVDKNNIFITYTDELDEIFSQKLDCYTYEMVLKWSYSIPNSIGWCSAPIHNDNFIFLRNRDGKAFCLEKSSGRLVWNTDKQYEYGSGDGSIYAVNDRYLVNSFFSNSVSYVSCIDLILQSSKPVWLIEVKDQVQQVMFYNSTIWLIGKKTIYKGEGDPPTLQVEPERIDVEAIENSKIQTILSITNLGTGLLTGNIKTETKWITILQDSFFNDTIIEIFIDTTGLTEGIYNGQIQIESNGGNKTIPVNLDIKRTDISPPVIKIINPVDGYNTSQYEILIQGQVFDIESGIQQFSINHHNVSIGDDDSFEYLMPLSLGVNEIIFKATNTIGLDSEKRISIIQTKSDEISPVIKIDSPTPGSKVNNENIIIRGSVIDGESGVKEFLINSNLVTLHENGTFEYLIKLDSGFNVILLEAIDNQNNVSSVQLEIIYESSFKIMIELWIGNRIAFINRKAITLDIAPLIYKGRTMVPLRFLVEAFGADIFYDPDEQEINIAYGVMYITLWIDKTKARLEITENQEKVNRIINLEAPPIIRNGRTLVPVRFIAEAFGAKIEWDSKEQKITIIHQSDKYE